MPRDYNYKNLQPLDVFCTAAGNVAGAAIRFRTARLRNRNGLREMFHRNIANHCAIVVKMENRYWLAEMCPDGLQINSCRKYLNNKDESIVAIKRHKKIAADPILREIGNQAIVDFAQKRSEYDYSALLAFIGIRSDDPREFYCSELCEVVVNKLGTTWDRWQLTNKPGPRRLIAPVEIQLGSPEYSDFITDIYVN